MSFEQVTDIRGVLVKLGLATPSSRAFVASTAAAGLMYLGGFPKVAFREDGSMKPLSFLSAEPDATSTHFLLLPAVVGAAAYVFT